MEHGHICGKKQTTFDIIKEGVNIGKANETTALEQAHLIMDRRIIEQEDDGYSKSITEIEKQKSISFDEPFPKELCFYKPKNSIDENKLKKLVKSGSAIFTVKRDGMMHIVRKSKAFGTEIYSRKMDLVTDKYPHLKSVFDQLPDGIVLLGEIILNKNGKDDFKSVSRICRSDAAESIEKQKQLGNVSYYIFDLAFYNHENKLQSATWEERHIILKEVITKYCKSKYIMCVERIDTKSHEEALKSVVNRGLEGLVVWDNSNKIKSGEDFTFNGKAYRPNVIWKLKPKYEDDFIVRFDPDNGIGDYGNGKNKSKIKNVQIYQLDENGSEVYLGKCGGGLSDEQRDFYTDVKKFPRVWRIEYDSVQPGTGALRFPVFNADRTLSGDKTMNECYMSDAIKQAREEDNDEEE